MKREVRKMERYSNETRLIVAEKLKTTEDVKNYILQTEKDVKDVTNLRQKYRKKNSLVLCEKVLFKQNAKILVFCLTLSKALILLYSYSIKDYSDIIN